MDEMNSAENIDYLDSEQVAREKERVTDITRYIIKYPIPEDLQDKKRTFDDVIIKILQDVVLSIDNGKFSKILQLPDKSKAIGLLRVYWKWAYHIFMHQAAPLDYFFTMDQIRKKHFILRSHSSSVGSNGTASSMKPVEHQNCTAVDKSDYTAENDPSSFHSSLDTEDTTIKLEIPEHTKDPLDPSSHDETAETSDDVFHKPSNVVYQSTIMAPEGVSKNNFPGLAVDYTDSEQVASERRRVTTIVNKMPELTLTVDELKGKKQKFDRAVTKVLDDVIAEIDDGKLAMILQLPDKSQILGLLRLYYKWVHIQLIHKIAPLGYFLTRAQIRKKLFYERTQKSSGPQLAASPRKRPKRTYQPEEESFDELFEDEASMNYIKSEPDTQKTDFEELEDLTGHIVDIGELMHVSLLKANRLSDEGLRMTLSKFLKQSIHLIQKAEVTLQDAKSLRLLEANIPDYSFDDKDIDSKHGVGDDPLRTKVEYSDSDETKDPPVKPEDSLMSPVVPTDFVHVELTSQASADHSFPENNKEKDDSGVQKEPKRKYQKEHSCDECEFKGHFAALVEHRTKKHEHPEFQCVLCDYVGKNYKHVYDHFKREHCDGKFYCDKCPFSGHSKSHLQMHVDNKHEGKKYTCDQCGAESTTSYSLRTHIRAVHEKKKFYCTETGCDRSFTDKRTLFEHVQGIHKGIVQKCDICDFSTLTTKTLRAHMKKHKASTNLKCDECDYTAPDNSVLNDHKNRHKGVTYKCFVCDHESLNKKARRVHERTVHKVKARRARGHVLEIEDL